ncbi:Sec-C motif domain protein [Tenacibaculum holothuriorum]|uniref:Sec-C motif domain protein n=1 Tax=Tenacibaculum holothuriorum TaxID=1635173 RepID=A0A1Y2PGC9_9FLAO|nr:YchJ family metal-binding protein [Tenacibaculum holothuriorum]OSY89534.1 Sec-C motif domain protein [Tenacibaculum holothuriorum]
MNCPCNPSKKYSECCKPIHEDIQKAFTAEQLMRSRYSAFVLANVDYLQKSHHSTTRPSKKEKREILSWTKSVQWLKLEVLHTTKGTTSDTKGTVEFKAYFMENGSIDIIHENSFFSKENGHWVYVKAN